MSDTIATLTTQLEAATARRDRLQALADRADRAANAVTPGGLTGYDPAILSGIRRKPNHKDDRRRFGAYTRQAEAWQELYEARERVNTLTTRLHRAQKDAAAPRDVDSLKPGDLVRDSTGWHRVVRVNTKTVSVETGYSWTDRIDKGRIVETRSIA